MTNKKEMYPLPKFHFQVEWGDAKMGFTEVSGLDFETEVIEYREGNSPAYHKTKQPGLTKYSNVTLKRGIFYNDFAYFKQWRKTFLFQEGKVAYRKTITVKLLDEDHQPVISWTLNDAWPVKVQSTDLKADANEVAIETLEVAHEGLSIVEAGQ